MTSFPRCTAALAVGAAFAQTRVLGFYDCFRIHGVSHCLSWALSGFSTSSSRVARSLPRVQPVDLATTNDNRLTNQKI
jgi:hypothetical protein